MSNQNSPSTAATYQSIIIALVAAGILSTGLVSIIYRRRQRQRLLRASQGGMRTIILPDGRVFSVPREGMNGGGVGRGRGKKVGKEPGIWDTVLGDVEEPEGNEKRRKGGEEREKGEWVGEVEVKGDWQVSPFSIKFCSKDEVDEYTSYSLYHWLSHHPSSHPNG